MPYVGKHVFGPVGGFLAEPVGSLVLEACVQTLYERFVGKSCVRACWRSNASAHEIIINQLIWSAWILRRIKSK